MQLSTRPRLDEPPPDVGPDRADLGFDSFYEAHFRSLTTQLCAYTGDLGLRNNESAELHGKGWSACEETDAVTEWGAGGISRQLTCVMTRLRAGETKTLVLGVSIATPEPSAKTGKATVVRLDAKSSPVADANEDDNSVTFSLR